MMGLLSTKIIEYKEYYNNGQLKYHYFKKGDIRHGEDKCYDNDGSLAYESHCNDGLLCKYKTFYDQNRLQKDAVFHEFKNKDYHCTNDPQALCSKYASNQVCSQHSYALSARYFDNKLH
jgi:hypothetical protein